MHSVYRCIKNKHIEDEFDESCSQKLSPLTAEIEPLILLPHLDWKMGLTNL